MQSRGRRNLGCRVPRYPLAWKRCPKIGLGRGIIPAPNSEEDGAGYSGAMSPRFPRRYPLHKRTLKLKSNSEYSSMSGSAHAWVWESKGVELGGSYKGLIQFHFMQALIVTSQLKITTHTRPHENLLPRSISYEIP